MAEKYIAQCSVVVNAVSRRESKWQRTGTDFNEISDIWMGFECSMEQSKKKSEIHIEQILVFVSF
jgi:hypothetical protein